MVNSVDPDQTAPIGAVCSGFTQFASIPNLSAMLGNSLQQTTFSDAFFFLNQLNSTHLVIELYEIASFFTKFKAWSCSYQSCWGGWVAAGVGDRKST